MKSFYANVLTLYLPKALNGLNLTVVHATPHMNAHARQLSTRILHNNRTWSPLFTNLYFNSSFQASYHLNPRISLTPTDLLLTECVYSTAGHPAFVLGGFGARSELCQLFLLYYPRQPAFKHCQSFPDVLEQQSLISSLTK